MLNDCLGHASIPQVFGWGRSQFYEYLAMELLGCNLETRLDKEGLTRRNFVSLVLQMVYLRLLSHFRKNYGV